MKTSYDIKSRNNLSYDCFYVTLSYEGFGIVPLGSYARLRVKVDRIEAGLLTKGSPVRDGGDPLVQDDEALAAKVLQRAIDVEVQQVERTSHAGLCQRPLYAVMLCQTDGMEFHVHLAEQVRDALLGRAPA